MIMIFILFLILIFLILLIYYGTFCKTCVPMTREDPVISDDDFDF